MRECGRKNCDKQACPSSTSETKDRGRHKKKKNVVGAAKTERFTGTYREEMRTEKKTIYSFVCKIFLDNVGQ